MTKKIESVLVVEDDPDIRTIAKMALEEVAGYKVLLAEEGQSGYESAVKNKPDLILLDIMMPGMDGIQTLGLLKKDEATRNIPVIFLTAKAQDNETQEYVEHGAIASGKHRWQQGFDQCQRRKDIALVDGLQLLVFQCENALLVTWPLVDRVVEQQVNVAKMIKCGFCGVHHTRLLQNVATQTERFGALALNRSRC